jgi:hypothetical protein
LRTGFSPVTDTPSVVGKRSGRPEDPNGKNGKNTFSDYLEAGIEEAFLEKSLEAEIVV